MRKIKKVTTILFIVSFFFPFSAQTENEYHLPNLITNIDETSLATPAYVTGQHWFRKLHGNRGFIHYPPAYEYLKNTLSILLPVTNLHRKKVEIGLLNSRQSNAFVLPGNHLFIYSNILSLIDTEEKLLALLAHELAHLDLRHYERRVENNKEESGKALAFIGAGIAAVLSGVDGEASSALLLSGIANKQENMLANSRRHEAEADKQARHYLLQAGLNPNAMQSLFLSFFRASIGRTKLEFLSTHPIPDSRLSDSITAVDTSNKTKSSTLFADFRTIMLTYRAALESDSTNKLLAEIKDKTQQNHALALLAFLKDDFELAKTYLSSLDENNNTQAYLKAKILLATNQNKAALEIINNKLAINPNSLMFLSLLESSTAIENLEYSSIDLLHYEKKLINDLQIEKAKQDKNLALVFAYQALDEFNDGKKFRALTLLNKAEDLITPSNEAAINNIKTKIYAVIDAEKLYQIEES